MDVLRDVCKYIRTVTLELPTCDYIDFLCGLSEWCQSEAEVLEWRLEENEEQIGLSRLNNN